MVTWESVKMSTLVLIGKTKIAAKIATSSAKEEEGWGRDKEALKERRSSKRLTCNQAIPIRAAELPKLERELSV